MRKILSRYLRYEDYLQSLSWIKKAHQFKHDHPSCFRCGGVGQNVHHKTYERIGTELQSDLVVLCRDCHQLVHTYVQSLPLHKRRRALRSAHLKIGQPRLPGVEKGIEPYEHFVTINRNDFKKLTKLFLGR